MAAVDATWCAKATVSFLVLVLVVVAATGTAEGEHSVNLDPAHVRSMSGCMMGCAIDVVDKAMEIMGCAMGCAGNAARNQATDNCAQDDLGCLDDPRSPGTGSMGR
ncbi:hypothetical protein ACP70R_009613 [Stipagrostis hirtigluma subsp. patula]